MCSAVLKYSYHAELHLHFTTKTKNKTRNDTQSPIRLHCNLTRSVYRYSINRLIDIGIRMLFNSEWVKLLIEQLLTQVAL